jgi:hypothetical protein
MLYAQFPDLSSGTRRALRTCNAARCEAVSSCNDDGVCEIPRNQPRSFTRCKGPQRPLSPEAQMRILISVPCFAKRPRTDRHDRTAIIGCIPMAIAAEIAFQFEPNEISIRACEPIFQNMYFRDEKAILHGLVTNCQPVIGEPFQRCWVCFGDRSLRA